MKQVIPASNGMVIAITGFSITISIVALNVTLKATNVVLLGILEALAEIQKCIVLLGQIQAG